MKQRDLQETFHFSTEQIDAPEGLQQLRERVQILKNKGIFLGAHSWRFQSWKKSFYLEKYEREVDFFQRSIEEYQKNLPTVVIDQSRLPSANVDFFNGLSRQLNASFYPLFKMPYDLTNKEFPIEPAFANQAGKASESYLDIEKALAFIERIQALEMPHARYAFFLDKEWQNISNELIDFFLTLSAQKVIAISCPLVGVYPDWLIQGINNQRMIPILSFTKFLESPDFPFSSDELVISSQLDRREGLEVLFASDAVRKKIQENLILPKRTFIYLENFSDQLAPELISRLSKSLI
ncbi:MAG: hypothetical protein M9962_06415 [Oligoflexia bacterium]|nr:hypothetical protein [Oligoflexia bacterium]